MTAPSRRDQRQSFRCPATDSQQEAVLKVGEVRLAARVLDESAGGFAIGVAGPPRLNGNDLAQLRTEAGWFEVRISNVAAVDATATPSSNAEESPQAEYRLGLQRLREIDPPAGEQPQAARHWFRFSLVRVLTQLFPSQHSMLAVGVVFAVVVVGVPLAAVALLWHGDRPFMKTVVKWGENAVSAVVGKSKPQSHPLPPPRPDSTHRNPIISQTDAREPRGDATPQRTNAGQPASGSTADATPFAELRRTVRRLPGVMAFTLPEAVRFLGLTGAQQEAIRQIDEATARSVQDLDAKSPGGNRHELAQQRTAVLDAARRRAVETLTGQQRARWQELTAEER